MAATRRVWAWVALSACVFLSEAVADDQAAQSRVKAFRYVVRTGDTPSQLAQRWGLPQPIIATPGRVLRVGEVITVPLLARTKVRRGESLSALSQKYGVSVETLAKFNRVPPPYRVKTGQVIMVPALK